jgi:hypothetical protein
MCFSGTEPRVFVKNIAAQVYIQGGVTCQGGLHQNLAPISVLDLLENIPAKKLLCERFNAGNTFA